ncbi:MAG TPA: hypothetical protein VF746_31465 [Longimicrobium sp.]|jgi:hypothetical protein
MSRALPPLPTLHDLDARLADACAATATLPPGGGIAVRTLFVLLYAGAVAGAERWIRPTQVARMTDEQARLGSDAERTRWAEAAARPGHAPEGRRWYAENTRESVRGVLNDTLLAMGAVVLRPALAAQSAAPRWALDPAFARYLTAPTSEAPAALAAWLAARAAPRPPDDSAERLAVLLRRAAGAAESFLGKRQDHPAGASLRGAVEAARAAGLALSSARPHPPGENAG